MTQFAVALRANDVLDAPVDQIWTVLRDPDMLAELTPLIDQITVRRADGEQEVWTWCLTGVTALGMTAAPCFTERMQFQGMGGISFVHDPPRDRPERAGAAGRYLVVPESEGRTRLQIEIAITVDLPLPKLMAGAVERVMLATLKAGGERFGANLVTHLGGIGRRGMTVTRIEQSAVVLSLSEVPAG